MRRRAMETFTAIYAQRLRVVQIAARRPYRRRPRTRVANVRFAPRTRFHIPRVFSRLWPDTAEGAFGRERRKCRYAVDIGAEASAGQAPRGPQAVGLDAFLFASSTRRQAGERAAGSDRAAAESSSARRSALKRRQPAAAAMTSPAALSLWQPMPGMRERRRASGSAIRFAERQIIFGSSGEAE